MDVTIFITLGPGANVIKLFCPQFMNFRTEPGWRGLLEKNALACYETYGCKKFYKIGHRSGDDCSCLNDEAPCLSPYNGKSCTEERDTQRT
jgi:hypothetical protein